MISLAGIIGKGFFNVQKTFWNSWNTCFITEHALESASLDNSRPLLPRNIRLYGGRGRKLYFTEKQIDKLVKHATKNKLDELKKWMVIAAECGFGVASRTAVNTAFKSRSYRRYRVSRKPFLSEAM